MCGTHEGLYDWPFPMKAIQRSLGWERQQGFTMIELLVVIILIVILSLIAIPVFLSQREKAWDANVESDLHNAAIAQVTFYQDNKTYTLDLDDLLDAGYSNSSKITLDIVSAADEYFCMQASHASNADRFWYVESGAGNPNPIPGKCPAAP
jgi:type IV pilus assembly protein PilA